MQEIFKIDTLSYDTIISLSSDSIKSDTIMIVINQLNEVSYIEYILTFLSLVIAIGVFWVGHNHNKLAVRPYLHFTNNLSNSEMASMIMTNKGMGPAIIKEMLYTIGRPKGHGYIISNKASQARLKEHIDEYAKTLNLNVDVVIYDVNSVIGVNEGVKLIKLVNGKLSDFIKFAETLSIGVIFEDIHKKQFFNPFSDRKLMVKNIKKLQNNSIKTSL